MDFEFIKNEDGSWGLFNTTVDDIYFSNIGAHKEALEKFVIPAKPQNIKKKNIRILDVCYGMGFNSKTFVDYCIKNNLNFNFEIDCIEIDKKILALGLLLFDKNISMDVHLNFGRKILEVVDLEKNIKEILGENRIKLFLDEIKANNLENIPFLEVFLSQSAPKNSFLHNIYYQNQSINNIFTSDLNIFVILDDLLSSFSKIQNKYDLIFHDAFSIRKQPELWTQEVFEQYYKILEPSGKLLTYSNSRVVRRILEKIGFTVEINLNPAGKQNGTIAIKT